MNKVVVYKKNGHLVILHPTPDAVEVFGIDAIAQKDVPAGEPYAIIDASQLPADRTFRAAWDVDDSLLVDGVGAEWSTFNEGGVQP